MFHFYLGESIPNIADWIQAIASVFAAIGLVYTLRLQYKSNKYQAKQFQRGILPHITVSAAIDPDPFWAEFRGGILTIEIHKNSAYNVRLNLLENSILTLEHVNVWGMDLAEGRSLRKNFTFPKDYDSTLDIHTNIALEITFEDSIGTKYSQIVHGNINDGIAARSPKEILN